MSSLLSMMLLTLLTRDHVAQGRGVEPAAAALAPGRGAELVALLEQVRADLVVQLRRERPRADPRGVGLQDADDLVDLERPDTPPPVQAPPAMGLLDVT